MLGKQLFAAIRRGETPQRIPFVPTIYEHGAALLGVTPSVAARNADLLAAGQLRAYELYQQDLAAVGLDIYNIEVEALGGHIVYPQDATLPFLQNAILPALGDVQQLSLPDPDRDGRMPLMLEALRTVLREIGGEVPVSGTVTGPFTLAALLRGFENFVADLLLEPAAAGRLLMFCAEVGAVWARRLVQEGASVAVNESWIVPPLLSPELYTRCVVPAETALIEDIRASGQANTALICGGDTAPIVPAMLTTGTSLIMADHNTDQEGVAQACRDASVLLRGSISPVLLEQGTDAELEAGVRRVLEQCADYEGFLFGCGIVSYATPPERVLRLKALVAELTTEYRGETQ